MIDRIRFTKTFDQHYKVQKNNCSEMLTISNSYFLLLRLKV